MTSTPWDLTDAIAEGDAARRARGARPASFNDAGAATRCSCSRALHRHYGCRPLLRLDGADIHDEAGAAAATGLGALLPRRKALEQSVGASAMSAVARAISFLAAADLDLRGRVDWPPELVIEVLVARLAQLSRMGRPAGRGRARRRAGRRWAP